jgi:hypothetical protein
MRLLVGASDKGKQTLNVLLRSRRKRVSNPRYEAFLGEFGIRPLLGQFNCKLCVAVVAFRVADPAHHSLPRMFALFVSCLIPGFDLCGFPTHAAFHWQTISHAKLGHLGLAGSALTVSIEKLLLTPIFEINGSPRCWPSAAELRAKR